MQAIQPSKKIQKRHRNSKKSNIASNLQQTTTPQQFILKDLQISEPKLDQTIQISQFPIPLIDPSNENSAINIQSFLNQIQKHPNFPYQAHSYLLSIFIDSSQTYQQIYPQSFSLQNDDSQKSNIDALSSTQDLQNTSLFDLEFNMSLEPDISLQPQCLPQFYLQAEPNVNDLSIKYWRNTSTIFLQILSDKSLKKKRKRNMGNQKRLKERGITEVIDLVQEWRMIHKESGKLNLDQVAAQLQVSRKTMDDYSLQLRKAEQAGFNFKNHQEDKMGVLRNFVKKNYTKGIVEIKKKEKDQSTLMLQSVETQKNYESIDKLINMQIGIADIETFLELGEC